MPLRLPADIFIAPSFPPSSAKCCHDTLPRRPSRSRKRLWAPRLSAPRIHHQGEAAGALSETPWPLLGCPALPTNLASLRRRQPIKPAPLPVPWLRGSAPAVQGALSLALDAPDGWRAAAVLECRCGCPWRSLDVLGRCKVRTSSNMASSIWIGRGHLSSSANELGGCVLSIPQCSKEHARWLPLG